MKKIALSCLLLTSVALAETIPLKSLITGSGGQIRVTDGIFLVSKRTADLTYLTLGIGSSAKGGRVDGVTVYAAKEYLTPAELDLFTKSVRQVALKCMNLRPERMTALTAWISKQNASALRDVSFDFGPMTANFRRSITSDGTYQTYVTMFRAGQPGVNPWVNYCVR